MRKSRSENVNEGKFKVDDLVYNKKTKTVGIVRMGDDKYGEVKTDADGLFHVYQIGEDEGEWNYVKMTEDYDVLTEVTFNPDTDTISL